MMRDADERCYDAAQRAYDVLICARAQQRCFTPFFLIITSPDTPPSFFLLILIIIISLIFSCL